MDGERNLCPKPITTTEKTMKRILLTIIGIVGVLIGLGFIFPALAQLRTSGSLPTPGVALLLLGIVLTLGGGGAAFCGLKRRRA